MTATLSHPPESEATPSRSWRNWLYVRPAGFDYATLLLLQLARVWGIWKWRDIAGGDESFYYNSAWTWFRAGRGHVLFSPVYTSMWGLLLHIRRDPVVTGVALRMLIIFGVTALVLAVVRRMLPRHLAWLVAAWWAVMPVNFDTTYSVHLFAVVPILLAWWAVLARPDAWGRGTALALMLIAMFLFRTEMVVSVASVGAVCAAYEWWRWARRREDLKRLPATLVGYAVPILLAVAVIGFYYARSTYRGAALAGQVHVKHVLSMGQAYALGYAERHPEWAGNPWGDYAEACRPDFGPVEPTLSNMLRRNPAALVRHALWNVRLFPAAMQLLLFDATSDPRHPDVVPQETGSRYALAMSVLAALFVVAAGWLAYRGRTRSQSKPVGGRGLAPAMIAASVLFTVPVVLLLRPRPAYLFSLELLAMVLIALSLWTLVGSWPIWRRLTPLMIPLMLVLPVLVPSRYGDAKVHGQRPLAEACERLVPFTDEFSRPGAAYLGPYSVEVQNYLGHGDCPALDIDTLENDAGAGSLLDILNSHGVTLFYVDFDSWKRIESARPGAFAAFLDEGKSAGWQVRARRDAGSRSWMLLEKLPPGSAGAFPVPTRFKSASAFGGFTPVSGLLPLEGPYPRENLPLIRWALYPKTRIAARSEKGEPLTLKLSARTPFGSQTVRITLDGREIARSPIGQVSFTDLEIPLDLAPGQHQIEFDWSIYQIPDPVHNPQLKQAAILRMLRVEP